MCSSDLSDEVACTAVSETDAFPSQVILQAIRILIPKFSVRVSVGSLYSCSRHSPDPSESLVLFHLTRIFSFAQRFSISYITYSYIMPIAIHFISLLYSDAVYGFTLGRADAGPLIPIIVKLLSGHQSQANVGLI